MGSYSFLMLSEGSIAIRIGGRYLRATARSNRANMMARASDHGIHQLFLDLSDLEETDLTGSDFVGSGLFQLANRSPEDRDWRQAVYAPANSYGFGIARMYEGFAANYEGIEIRSYDDADKAIGWLGLNHRYCDLLEDPHWKMVGPDSLRS